MVSIELGFNSCLTNTSQCLKATTHGLEMHFLFLHHVNQVYVHTYGPNERTIIFCRGKVDLQLSSSGTIIQLPCTVSAEMSLSHRTEEREERVQQIFSIFSLIRSISKYDSWYYAVENWFHFMLLTYLKILMSLGITLISL